MDIILAVLNAVVVIRRLTELLEHDVLESLVRHELHPAVELQTKVREDFIIGPSRGLLLVASTY